MFKKILYVALAALMVFGAIGPTPLFISWVAHAASPNELSYQGRLKDSDGIVVDDGSYDFTFKLWTALTGGTMDWTEVQTLTVTDGYFSAQLGAVDPFLNGAGEEANFTVPLFLEVEVEAETLVPRVAVNSVAYSFSSRSVESFASEAAAETDASNFGGRMYYNTTDGNLYVYDSIETDWVDTTVAIATFDDAYDNFETDPAVVNVDNGEDQGDLTFVLDGADVIMVDSTAETFVTFSDAGDTTIDGDFYVNGGISTETGTALTLNSGDVDAINIGNDTDAESINIGTGAAAKAILIGNVIGTTGVTVEAGTGGINLGDVGDTNTIHIGGVTNNGNDTIEIATNATDTDTVTIGNTNAATTLSLTGGNDWSLAATGVLTLSASAAQTTALVITDTDYTNALSIGDNAIIGTTGTLDFTNFDVSAVGQITVAAGQGIDTNAAGTLSFGNANATIASICESANCDTVNIATNGDANSVNIATDGASNTVYIGSSTGTTSISINAGTGGVNLGDTDNQNLIDVGGVTFDGEDTVSIATDGTTDDEITIGNTNAATTLSLTGGNDWSLAATGVLTLSASAAQTTALVITDTDYTNALSIGDNLILGTAAGIDFSEFDVSASTGSVTINDGSNNGQLNVEGTILNIDQLTFTGEAYLYAGSGSAMTIIGGDDGTDAGEDVIIDSENWNVSATGLIDSTGGLSVTAGDIALTDNVGTAWSISSAGVAQFGAGVTIAGTADGTDALDVTLGDIHVSNGDLSVSGGDFDVVLDAADGATVGNTGATTGTAVLSVLQTTDASNVTDTSGLQVEAAFTNYADDGVADIREGINVVVTNNASDAGADDTISGINVRSLVGSNQSDGSEFGIRLGTNWDADFQLGNGETVSNQVDDVITFGGNGGTNNAELTIDLDGASSAVPTLMSGAANHMNIFSSLSVGMDGNTTENIANTGFAFGGSNDLYVDDDFGVNGDAYFDGIVSFGSETQLTADSATPSVSSGNHFNFTNVNPTTVTNFTGGQAGQMIFVRVTDAVTTLDCTGASLNCGTTDITLAAGDFLTFLLDGASTWELVALMDDSDNQNAGTGFDLAEWFPASEALVAGDVVTVDPNGIETVRKSQGAYETSVIGIVSTQPGLTIGEPASAFASQIALAGRVPVNVTNENGAIQPGDYLASSSTPGYAMKATEAGSVLGIAMGSFDGTSGQVVAKIASFWYVPPATEASALQGSDGSALAAGVLSADTVVVSGDALFEGSVTVEGHLYGGADMAGRARIISGDARVHVPFSNEYASQPIVTATLRTATDIPGYWWVEGESTTGFDIVLDGTLPYAVEFNWIALGIEAGRVSVSDGSSQEIDVYVVDGGVSEPVVPVVEEVVPEVAEEPVFAVDEEPATAIEEEPVMDDPIAPEETFVIEEDSEVVE